MKKAVIQTVIFLVYSTFCFAQEGNSKFSLSINYGLNGSFFVKSYYDGGPGIQYYEKDFIGTSGGGELRYHLNKRSMINIGYMQSNNKREVDFYGSNNSITLDILNFTIRHTEHIFYGGYEWNISKRNPGFSVQGGIYYVKPVQQEIEILPNTINIWERKQSNAGLNEIGVYAGLQYHHKIDTHFDLGIQSRVFYEITTGILSQITLTPTLSYRFAKSKNKR